MRLLAALTFIGVGMWATFAWLDQETVPAFLPAVVMLALMLSSVLLFNRNPWGRLTRQSLGDYIALLDRKGLLVREPHVSGRALCYEDLDTGCLAYLIEVADGRVLCLYGQDLGSYGPFDAEDGEPARPRRFPCERFTLLKHAKNGRIVDMVLEGAVFEPETIPQPHHKTLAALDIDVHDGKVYSHITYDGLKSAFTRAHSRMR